MRKKTVLTSTAFVLLAAGMAQAQSSGALKPLALDALQALKAADIQLTHSFSDPDRFASFYAEDATLYAPNMPIVKGHTAIRELIGDLDHARGTAFQTRTLNTQVGVGGNLGYTTGIWQLTKSDGTIDSGKYLTVWEVQADGQWKIVEDFCYADDLLDDNKSASVEIDLSKAVAAAK